MPVIFHFLAHFAVKLSVLDHHLQYTCETSFKYIASTFHMDYISKDALVIRAGSKMRKRKKDTIQTPKETPKDKHSK